MGSCEEIEISIFRLPIFNDLGAKKSRFFNFFTASGYWVERLP
jgi:hypothetical protein